MVQKGWGEKEKIWKKSAITKPYSTPILCHKLYESVWISMQLQDLLPNICCPINSRQRWTALHQEVTHININAHLLRQKGATSLWMEDDGSGIIGIMVSILQTLRSTCHVPIRADTCPVQASWSHVVSGTRFWLISSESSTANRPNVSCRISFRFFSVCSMLWWCLPMINVFLMESCTFHPLSEYVGCHRPRRQWAFRLPRSGNLLQQYRDTSDTWWVSTPVIDLYFKGWKST